MSNAAMNIARLFCAGALGLLLAYCAVLVVLAVWAALTAPIWIWWVV